MMKRIFFLLIGLVLLSKARGQNILDLQDWKVGQGNLSAFNINGELQENFREWGTGPHGDRVVLWKAVPDGLANADGGWNSNLVNIDHQKMYRFTIWLKKTNSNDGDSYFGCQDVLHLDNSSAENPYFWYGNLPELDKWYLLVGFIHASNDSATEHYGGIYDGATGKKVVSIQDYKFGAWSTLAMHRTYLYYDPNTNDRQYFYAPRVEVVNGNEPSIASLLGINTASNNIGYFAGNVGIKTLTPRDYELAVNGKIRSKEVKVEAANWPDYVFEKGYENKSLEELEKFIQKNKHLPGVPSAKEVEQNGVELGEMNKILLKKIEELTLYIIDLKKEITASKRLNN